MLTLVKVQVICFTSTSFYSCYMYLWPQRPAPWPVLAAALGPLACTIRSARPRKCLNLTSTKQYKNKKLSSCPRQFRALAALNYKNRDKYIYVRVRLRQFMVRALRLGQARGPSAQARGRAPLLEWALSLSCNSTRHARVISPLHVLYVKIINTLDIKFHGYIQNQILLLYKIQKNITLFIPANTSS